MKKVVEYLPSKIIFVLNEDLLTESFPESFGKFKTVKEIQKFLQSHNFITLNPKLEVTREMDEIEVNDLRSMYINELEEIIPELERNALIAQTNFDNAKKHLSEQKERVSASHTKVDMLISEINEGTIGMALDQSRTFELAFQDKYLYYTLINGELVLCHVKNIPEYERGDMFNSTDANQEAMKSIVKVKKANQIVQTIQEKRKEIKLSEIIGFRTMEAGEKKGPIA